MVQIPKSFYDAIIAHCQQEYPKEACGLLAGSDSPQASIVQIYPMRNVEASPIGYAMDPKEQLQVEKQMRQRQQRLCGIYHSHTASAAFPSSVDVSLALGPEISYVLVSVKERSSPLLKSYRIDRSHPTQPITEEPVILLDAIGGSSDY